MNCKHLTFDHDSFCPECKAALAEVKRQARTDAIRNLASAIQKVCPEVIPQIMSAAHPEDEFIAALRAEGVKL